MKAPRPLFDTADAMGFEPILPSYLQDSSPYIHSDFSCAHAFLHAYKDNTATYNAYRREVERLLHWSWLYAERSILTLKRIEIESYIKFCQNPPKSWIGVKKVARYRLQDGIRQPNAEWRPFVATVSKVAARRGNLPNIDEYEMSEKAVREVFAVLSSFYNFLIQEERTESNPVAQIRQKSKFIRKQQTRAKIRRLSDEQWQAVLMTAQKLAECEPDKHERTLFIMSCLYGMYLRISELAASQRWTPEMSDFRQDHDGNWWFITVGKGNKERQIAVSDAMLLALKRWRLFLGYTALPGMEETAPLVPKDRGKGPISSTNQIRNIVQFCFDRAIQSLYDAKHDSEAAGLESATVHWLRHTGISDDVKRRPREHVRDDAGHSSSQTTDRYIDIGLKERHASAQDKPLLEGNS